MSRHGDSLQVSCTQIRQIIDSVTDLSESETESSLITCEKIIGELLKQDILSRLSSKKTLKLLACELILHIVENDSMSTPDSRPEIDSQKKQSQSQSQESEEDNQLILEQLQLIIEKKSHRIQELSQLCEENLQKQAETRKQLTSLKTSLHSREQQLKDVTLKCQQLELATHRHRQMGQQSKANFHFFKQTGNIQGPRFQNNLSESTEKSNKIQITTSDTIPSLKVLGGQRELSLEGSRKNRTSFKLLGQKSTSREGLQTQSSDPFSCKTESNSSFLRMLLCQAVSLECML